MKIHVIIKEVYNPAYGRLESKSIVEAHINSGIAKDRVCKLEQKIYDRPTYFSIETAELINN